MRRIGGYSPEKADDNSDKVVKQFSISVPVKLDDWGPVYHAVSGVDAVVL